MHTSVFTWAMKVLTKIEVALFVCTNVANMIMAHSSARYEHWLINVNVYRTENMRLI